ncbi:PP2C family protein-serine/threonine phosphatase [Klebsiella variicola]|uniref:PP2C family protein-serine/threonine phosphatase n=1 Tax=Klebsiella variicola TaxID=244366 RepID=UPI00217E428B|nr:protein phosphatase 2C domain-containing protein [Klebsiella variicola]MCS5871039.1 protein phosphatase 2C domain-containing protein [Klebsiella variicola subsp. variicola]HCI6898929.1 protein phosphatase 2C domain-containing protein [Klebsiella quasipneumoniae subsp. quasipneumoniae]
MPVAIATDIGLVRKENQDRVSVLKFRPVNKTKDMVVVALADGMGGMEGGGNAASLTLSTFFTEVIRSSHLNIRECLEKAILKANEAVLKLYKGNGGATLTAIVLDGSEYITTANVGDSRIYGITNDGIVQLSEDDTLVALAKKYNNIDIKSSDIDSRFGGELVQFIGIDSVLQIHFYDITAPQGGAVLLSSDGAHIIGDSNLNKLFVHSSNTGVYARRIIDLASWFGGFDNASVAVVELDGILKELDVSSGYVINIWDPFGELKLVNLPQAGSNVIDNKGQVDNGDSKDNNKIHESIVRKAAVVKRKTRSKSSNAKNIEKKELNKNEELENISQLDMSFPERNSVKGDENEK